MIFYVVSVLQSNVNSAKAGLYLLITLGLVFYSILHINFFGSKFFSHVKRMTCLSIHCRL